MGVVGQVCATDGELKSLDVAMTDGELKSLDVAS